MKQISKSDTDTLDEISRLAEDINEFMDDYAPYEHRDIVDDEDESIREIKSELSQGANSYKSFYRISSMRNRRMNFPKSSREQSCFYSA